MVTASLPQLLQSSLLATTVLAGAVAPEATPDCSLNGDLINGTCHCDIQWAGNECQFLRLLPADPAAGLQAKGNFSSWGGSVQKGADGVYHMYVSVMANGCGLDAWRPNSQIGHATSRTPNGPYKLEAIIKPHFAHSPEVVKGPHGEWLVYHVGAGVNNKAPCPNPDAPTCQWATNCSAGCTGPQHPILSGLSFFGPASVMKAASPAGPWSDHVIGACAKVPGCEPSGSFVGNGNDQNPAPLIHKDGSVTMLWRSINYSRASGQSYYARATAPRWSGPYTWHTENIFPAFSYCHIEDGFLYKNKRGFHALFHSDCELPQGHMAGGAAGGHGYSVGASPCSLTVGQQSEDGINWSFHPQNAYNNNVTMTDGSSWRLSRRERPKLILDKSGNPTHLINGVTRRGAANGCKDGDHSFTFIQPIAQS